MKLISSSNPAQLEPKHFSVQRKSQSVNISSVEIICLGSKFQCKNAFDQDEFKL